MNGMNGGNMPGAVVGLPTPAGHQAELNYIYGMVEELSRQLAENKRALEDVVAGVGRVRHRARTLGLGNEELLSSAADDVSAQTANMDTFISLLSDALEKAKYSRDANAALLTQYASVLSSLLKQFHEYKSKHVTDVAAWHRSYRTQLAEARAENSRLREQMWEMQQHAGQANELLRNFRTHYDDDPVRRECRVENVALRQEVRFWKRMAMPELAEDDPYWSDDDDLIDSAEKARLRELEKVVAQEQLAGAADRTSDQEGSEEGDGVSVAPLQHPRPQQTQHGTSAGFSAPLGGVAMQREDSGTLGGVPIPPPRPSSAQSTGSSGQ